MFLIDSISDRQTQIYSTQNIKFTRYIVYLIYSIAHLQYSRYIVQTLKVQQDIQIVQQRYSVKCVVYKIYWIQDIWYLQYLRFMVFNVIITSEMQHIRYIGVDVLIQGRLRVCVYGFSASNQDDSFTIKTILMQGSE